MLTTSQSQSLQFTNHAYATRGHEHKIAINRFNEIIFSNYFVNRVTGIFYQTFVSPLIH